MNSDPLSDFAKARLRLHLAYDGTGYLGWQKQVKQPGSTVQEELEKALKKLTLLDLTTTGSGRTDSGVHALNQVVHLDVPFGLISKIDWVRGLNRFLPEQIQVQKALVAPPDFHALRSALNKTYTYQIQDGPAPNPLASRQAHWVSSPLDLEYLNELSQVLVGTHDFKSFQTEGTPLKTTVRTLYTLSWHRRPADNMVVATLNGSGFLKQMVRNLVGALLHQYWKKNLSQEHLFQILKACDRTKAHGTAPAKGLILTQVSYPVGLDKLCHNP